MARVSALRLALVAARASGLALPRVLTAPGVRSDEAAALVAAAEEVTGWEFAAVAADGLGHDRCAVFEGIAPLSDETDGIAAALDAVGVDSLLTLGVETRWGSDAAGAEAARGAVAAYAACYGLGVAAPTAPTRWSAAAATVAENAAIDGDFIDDGGERVYDASRCAAIDGLVDEPLRAALLAAIRADADAPNADFWRRGGALSDVVGAGASGDCWGLDGAVLAELADEDDPPPALLELRSRLAAYVASVDAGAVVCSQPEAALGPAVPPVNANAPVAADKGRYGFHVDADPLQLPPSPFTDFYGRYPNRATGKPRFVSAVVYLAPDWGPDLGAPTVLLDPPTGEELRVDARPGRVLLLDQDISHKIEAPNGKAGDRPRYSLVLKLVLHPQDPASVPRFAPDPPTALIGSARPP